MLKGVRRLTAANFLMDRPGAAAEAEIDDRNKPFAMRLWRQEARALMDALGWQDEIIAMRAFDGGATLQISAPTDALYSATEVVEAAWERATARLNCAEAPDLGVTASAIGEKVAKERNPTGVALQLAAEAHGVAYLGHDDLVTVGLGEGSSTWKHGEAPDASTMDWSEVRDIPVAMVTGTNGKSTTVRLAAAIGAAAGHCVGLSSSDWVRVGDEIIDEGDYSGPAGARLALRDTRTSLAVIETARGGLMRRGMPVPRADACLLTNIAADHLGGYGITDVESLADAKFMIAHAVKPGGRLILNADDPALVARSAGYDGDITWFGLGMDADALDAWIRGGGHAAFMQDGEMVLARDGKKIPILPVSDFKPALGGAAKYNISNALGAIGIADALNLPVAAMTEGLARFTGSAEENPGRGNFIELGGVTLLLDFAHNPHGIAALAEAVSDIPAKRRLFLAGQAGDRSDEDTRDMTRAIWKATPDMVVVKELESKLRGRELGEMPAIIKDELEKLGAGPDQIAVAGDEFDAVKTALRWAREGDFLVLLLHDDRKPTMDLIDRLKHSGWQAGQAFSD